MAATLSSDRLHTLLLPYAPPRMLTPSLIDQLSIYLDLLVRWNAKTNLTAVRDPSMIVERHFGESLFAAQYVRPSGTLLDFGSGAGLPGIPIQLVYPQKSITLAESQQKKVAFLFEAARSLELPLRVWPQRVEDLPSETKFDAITLRAVDDMECALQTAERFTDSLCIFGSTGSQSLVATGSSFRFRSYAVPNSRQRTLFLGERRREVGRKAE